MATTSVIPPSQDAAQFALMAVQWQTIIDGSSVQDVGRWAKTLAKMQNEQRALRAAGLWVGGPTDLLSAVGQARSELVHSAAIAWLLDPAMHHGLGTRMLVHLLKRCFKDDQFADLTQASVYTEVTRGAARVDILVQAEGITLVIENKVDAPEGIDQCDAYFRLFGNDPGARFVFLSPDGRRPQSATGLAAEAFRPLGYREIMADLNAVLACTEHSPHGLGRAAAEQYLLTLRRQFT